MEFNFPKGKPAIIKVIGVGGGGSNAVNHMFLQGIKGVDFLVCNTDQQALDVSPVADKLQLGGTLTDGMGAGSVPDVGRNAAIESVDDILKVFAPETRMIFITAGMGGGTGTGAAPIIAEAARELGILTVGIVTLPFVFEGRKRKKQAEKGIEELRKAVDTLLIINNDRLREMYGNLKMSEVFAKADNVLTIAAKGIAEIITRTGHVNVDFQDVSTVMRNSGVAVMGASIASGDNRATKAIENALSSPLLNDNDIKGARFILLNMEFGDDEITMDEISDITDYVQEEAGSTADIIWGYGRNDEMKDGLSVTLIATGFDLTSTSSDDESSGASAKKVHNLADTQPKILTHPVRKKTDKSTGSPSSNVIDNSNMVQTRITFNLDTPEDTPKTVRLDPYIKEKSEDENTVNQYMPPSNKTRHNSGYELDVEENNENANDGGPESKNTKNEYDQRLKDRMAKLKEVSRRLRTDSGLTELENVPAYMRRSISLEDPPHSSESQVSRYSLDEPNENDEDSGGISNNNSFLHDNVD